jgi:hypothetical protein
MNWPWKGAATQQLKMSTTNCRDFAPIGRSTFAPTMWTSISPHSRAAALHPLASTAGRVKENNVRLVDLDPATKLLHQSNSDMNHHGNALTKVRNKHVDCAPKAVQDTCTYPIYLINTYTLICSNSDRFTIGSHL